MQYLIYFAFLAINAFCVAFHKRSRLIQVLSFIFLVILMGGNTYNNDYAGYENVYNGIQDSHFADEYGIMFLFYLGNLCSLSYQAMFFCILSIATLWLFLHAKKENADIHLVLVMYLAFGFIADTVVIRNYIAIAFFTSALLCLSRNEKKKSLIFMVLSVLFHKTMLFYFPLLFVNSNRAINKKIAKVGAISIVVACSVMFVCGGRFEFIAKVISKVIYGGESSVYIVGGVRYGFLIYFLVQIVTIFTIFYARNTLLRNRLQASPETISLLNLAYVVNCYVVLCFPLLMISVAMHRLFRNIMFFNLITLGVCHNSFESNKVSSRYYKFCLMLLMFALVWRVLYFFEMPVEFEQILNNNIFFKG